jgi:hypothetical protein
MSHSQLIPKFHILLAITVQILALYRNLVAKQSEKEMIIIGRNIRLGVCIRMIICTRQRACWSWIDCYSLWVRYFTRDTVPVGLSHKRRGL